MVKLGRGEERAVKDGLATLGAADLNLVPVHKIRLGV